MHLTITLGGNQRGQSPADRESLIRGLKELGFTTVNVLTQQGAIALELEGNFQINLKAEEQTERARG